MKARQKPEGQNTPTWSYIRLRGAMDVIRDH